LLLITDDDRGKCLRKSCWISNITPVCSITARTWRNFLNQSAKAIGFAKSGLAQSIYAELKVHRINQPVTKPNRPADGPRAGSI